MSFLLFPNQLYELKYIPNEYHEYKFYLYDHPLFYGKRKNMKMNFNKKKIILHKASILHYVDHIKLNIKIIKEYPKVNSIIYFDTLDKQLEEEINKKYDKKIKLESPNFISSSSQIKEFYEKNKNKKSFLHNSFYKYQLEIHKIPYIKKTYDKENREAIPKNEEIPNIKFPPLNVYIKKAIEIVKREYGNNYGDVENFYIPITHEDAKNWLKQFIKMRFKKFGIYQDAMIPDEAFLFHSVLSPMMNIGLINPEYIIKEVIKSYEKKEISINDYEAFIRQIIGWREYQRFIYEYLYNDIINENYFNNKKKLNKNWYEGTLGILPVDNVIKMAFKWGYIHHILRLMVMTNFMNLCGINPHEVYKWFMEFSVDSYDWVMIGNVYSMGMWCDGGLTMRKPYISTDNYISMMSGGRYEDGEWNEIWRGLFYIFLEKNEKKLRGTPYIRNLVYWKRNRNEKLINKMRKFLKIFI